MMIISQHQVANKRNHVHLKYLASAYSPSVVQPRCEVDNLLHLRNCTIKSSQGYHLNIRLPLDGFKVSKSALGHFIIQTASISCRGSSKPSAWVANSRTPSSSGRPSADVGCPDIVDKHASNSSLNGIRAKY